MFRNRSRRLAFPIVAAVVCVAVAAYLAVSNVLSRVATSPLTVATAEQIELAGPLPYEPACQVAYASEAAAAVESPANSEGLAHTSLPWDDGWFAADASVYNHDLARACMVLCAVVNSESRRYSGDEAGAAYAEEALADLGFSAVDTESFRYSSKASDEIAKLMDDSTDEVAYVFASKELPDGHVLVFVGVRGTYGAEWLSDLHVANPSWLGGQEDHAGYSIASAQMLFDLAEYLDGQGLLNSPERLKFLVSGHSRGASTANLLARDLLWAAESNMTGPGGVAFDASSVFAYTFAASPSTRSAEASDVAFKGIFNVVNPTDIVPKVPLVAWGYRCYGTTVMLPGLDTEGFDDAYAAMQARRAANSGAISEKPYRGGEACPAQACADELAERIPTVDDLASAGAAVSVVRTALEHDMYRILVSHFPDTYIAWMQTVDEDGLRFEE